MASFETSSRPSDHNRDIKPPAGFDPFELSRLKQEVRLLRFLADLGTHLRGARDAESAVRFAVRAGQEHFDADAACLAVSSPPYESAQIMFAVPQNKAWDLPAFAAVARGEKVAPQGNLMFARIRRRERPWGVLAFRRGGGEFDRSERQALARVGATISALLHEIDRERIREVRDRIDRKIMSELRPIDLSYQILDALRSLTRYDHSSAVLMNSGGPDSILEIVAEQIAWQKAKSTRIGSRVALGPDMIQLLRAGSVYGFTRVGGKWQPWEGQDAATTALAALLEYRVDEVARSEAELLCAPLRSRDGILGLLKVSACHPGTFGQYEADLLTAFVPQVSIAVQNSQRTETLESKMLAAERKHAMAELARGVSHDLNNALGSVLPIIQQMCAEAEEGKLDAATCAADLQHIEHSLNVCRRIFHGMLSFARRAATTVGSGQVRQAVDGTLSILEEGMRRRGINVEREVADPLPAVRCAQSDLEQLLLNLLSNARDAMPDGGTVTIRAKHQERDVRVEIQDSGCGIAKDDLPLVQEPFFTTKQTGSGLGLSICRSILWDIRGRLDIDSAVGRGTRVTVSLPAVLD